MSPVAWIFIFIGAIVVGLLLRGRSGKPITSIRTDNDKPPAGMPGKNIHRVEDLKALNTLLTDIENARMAIPLEGVDDVLGRDFLKLWSDVLQGLMDALATGKDSKTQFELLLTMAQDANLHVSWAVKRNQTDLFTRIINLSGKVYGHEIGIPDTLNS